MTSHIDPPRALLESHSQAHLLKFWDRLEPQQQRSLADQIRSIDFTLVQQLQGLISDNGGRRDAADFVPASVTPAGDLETGYLHTLGAKALSTGQVGVILVAGGQGTRLGFDGPKGTYPIGALSGDSLFKIHSRKILALERSYDAEICFYIMTSPANDAATKAFFADNGNFGLADDRVLFFTQGTYPALTPEGKLILDRPDHVFAGPDGHGGTIRALFDSGMLNDMSQRGISTLFYFQVDNPLVDIAAPAFIGYHLQKASDMSVKVCAKRDAAEGLGVVVDRDGHRAVVEYSELTDEQKHETGPDGELRFKYGSVAIHVFDRDFLAREAQADLPFHRAHKKVPFCRDDGTTEKPDSPNAYKFEKFIFDVLPDANTSTIVEFAREDEFAPLKNATGNDSPDSVRPAMSRKFARWLEACDVRVPRNPDGSPRSRIEIDPVYANSPGELKERMPPGLDAFEDLLLTK
jgi:UDP-N-acetylglucosamine/UDP-N-acetylgalactosamine diphosphorylase